MKFDKLLENWGFNISIEDCDLKNNNDNEFLIYLDKEFVYIKNFKFRFNNLNMKISLDRSNKVLNIILLRFYSELSEELMYKKRNIKKLDLFISDCQTITDKIPRGYSINFTNDNNEFEYLVSKDGGIVNSSKVIVK